MASFWADFTVFPMVFQKNICYMRVQWTCLENIFLNHKKIIKKQFFFFKHEVLATNSQILIEKLLKISKLLISKVDKFCGFFYCINSNLSTELQISTNFAAFSAHWTGDGLPKNVTPHKATNIAQILLLFFYTSWRWI